MLSVPRMVSPTQTPRLPAELRSHCRRSRWRRYPNWASEIVRSVGGVFDQHHKRHTSVRIPWTSRTISYLPDDNSIRFGCLLWDLHTNGQNAQYAKLFHSSHSSETNHSPAAMNPCAIACAILPPPINPIFVLALNMIMCVCSWLCRGWIVRHFSCLCSLEVGLRIRLPLIVH